MAWPLSCILVLHLTIILLYFSPSFSQDDGQFSIGQSLLANSGNTSVLSPSGDFVFGFHQFPNSTNLFLLSIWYAKIPDTIVWYANEGNPVPIGSKLIITANDGLVLSDPQGNHLWNTSDGTSSGGAVSYGFMNDTGNFVLKSNGNDAPVWQTFDHPTDTLLPTQVLEAGGEVDCRMSKTNFSKGRFQMRMLYDGNLVLNTRDVASGFSYGAYYVSGTNDAANPENVGERVVYSESGGMYILRKNGSRFDLIPSSMLKSAKEYYQRVTINYNGVLTWYYYPRASTGDKTVGWSEIKSLPDNICTQVTLFGGDFGSGACGYNSICRVDENDKPVCRCPPNYSLMDADETNGNCVPDFEPDVCEKLGGVAVKSEYGFIQLENTDWPFGDYARLDPTTEEQCKTSCLNDCFCAAAIFDGNSSCWKKKLPLSNGRQDSGLIRTAWLKVGSSNRTDYPINPFIPPRKLSNAVTTGLLGGSVCVNFVLLTVVGLVFFFRRNRKQSRRYDVLPGGSIYEYDIVHRFTYRKLESATNGFKEVIGSGSYGVVYKGTLTAGSNSTPIAVKKLDRIFMGADKEFTTEVNAIGLTHHKNLVRFIGYCKEDDQRLLVYEYMSNGTVAEYLFGELKPSWLSRINIAQGVARGLLYLHEECTTQIIHCDIKPQNVLVEEHHDARICDFGLAKLLVLNQNQTKTAVRGTKGYVAPEWFKNKPVSAKVDVYSYGVLLLEIVCCRRSVCIELSADERAILTDWAFDCYHSGMLDTLVNNDMEALNDVARLERFVKVALWCIQEDPNDRPTMKKVTLMLEGAAEVPTPLCPTSSSVTLQV